MADQYIGEIRPTGFNFAPVDWALCNGQLLPIQQYAALFTLLGVQFGGNGTTNFALPNLQGTVLTGAGSGAGLTPCVVGDSGGSTQVTLTPSQMPMHTHPPAANNTGGANPSPANSIWATELDGNGNPCTAYLPPPGNVTLPVTTAMPVGSSQPISILQPTLVVNYIIALQGNFPSRP